MARYLKWISFITLLAQVPWTFSSTCCDQRGCFSSIPCQSTEALFDNDCVVVCPFGYYSDKTSRKCQTCKATCKTCQDASHCTSCQDSFFVPSAGLCFKSCKAPLLAKSSGSPWVRLVGGKTNLEGRLEVYYDGAWGTVCDDKWDQTAANLVCQELNLGSAVEIIVDRERFRSINDGYEHTKIALSEVKCTGEEKSITECDHKGWNVTGCSHLEDVGITCSGPDTSTRCVKSCGEGYYVDKKQCSKCPLDCKTCDRPSRCSSCVQKRFLQGWDCVSRCRPGTYGDESSRKCVACPSSCQTCVKTIGSPQVKCTSCPPGTFLLRDKCVNKCGKLVTLSPYIRLSGLPSKPYQGRIEFRYKGKWRVMCTNVMSSPWAAPRVFCRELGYGPPVTTFDVPPIPTSKEDVLFTEIFCHGNEKSFVECRQNSWLTEKCFQYPIGLTCAAPVIDTPRVRECVEICPSGMFKSKSNDCELCNRVCAACENDADMCTACRTPYYLNGSTCLSRCPAGWIKNEKLRTCLSCDASRGCQTCQGRPDRCLSCLPGLLRNGTSCVTSCDTGTYRKGNTCVPDCGVMHYKDTKSRVCHACPFRCHVCVFQNSVVVCMLCSLGYVLDAQKNCVRNCPLDYVAVPANLSSVGIQPSLRLVSPTGSKLSGRLEVLHDGQWAPICNDNWYSTNSRVACKELLLEYAFGYERYQPGPWINESASKIWLQDVICDGRESSLVQCSMRGFVRSCPADHHVYLKCRGPGVSQCVDRCPAGFVSHNAICQPCQTGCLDCSGSVENCTKCIDDMTVNTDGRCVVGCPLGQYAVPDGSCRKCSSTCRTCEGSSNNCTSCQTPYFLFSSGCVLNCTNGTFKREDDGGIRFMKNTSLPGYNYGGVVQVDWNGKRSFICPPNERNLILEMAHVACRQLNMGPASIGRVVTVDLDSVSLLEPFCAGNESSLLQCVLFPRSSPRTCDNEHILAVACTSPDSARACVNCSTKAGYFVARDGFCRPCSANCLACSGSATNCTACSQRAFLYNNSCVKYCPEGTYLDAKSQMCLECDSNCLACVKTRDHCTACRRNQFLATNKTCITKCNPNYEMIDIPGVRLCCGKSNVPRRVDVYVHDSWAPVCAIDWDMEKAAMVCSWLGYGDPVKIEKSYSSNMVDASRRFQFTRCNGSYRNLTECFKENQLL